MFICKTIISAITLNQPNLTLIHSKTHPKHLNLKFPDLTHRHTLKQTDIHLHTHTHTNIHTKHIVLL